MLACAQARVCKCVFTRAHMFINYLLKRINSQPKNKNIRKIKLWPQKHKENETKPHVRATLFKCCAKSKFL